MTLSCESFDGCCFLDCLKNPTYIMSMNAILHVVLEPMATKVHGCYSAHFLLFSIFFGSDLRLQICVVLANI